LSRLLLNRKRNGTKVSRYLKKERSIKKVIMNKYRGPLTPVWRVREDIEI